MATASYRPDSNYLYRGKGVWIFDGWELERQNNSSRDL